MQLELKDAGFIWTEPHSRRIKVKITVQKEVLTVVVSSHHVPGTQRHCVATAPGDRIY